MSSVLNSTAVWVVIAVVAGGAYLLPSPVGLLQRLFSRTRSGTPDDPDVRRQFSEYHHWLSEFAREELQDPEMIDLLNGVHARFTMIRSQQEQS